MNTLFTRIIFLSLGASLIIGGLFYKPPKKDNLANCNALAYSDKITCWKNYIDKTLSLGKLDEAMGIVASLYNSEPEFIPNCHDFTHAIGKAAYERFAKGEDFKVGGETSYCAYGFYHGFMENLVSRSGDPASAREFCKKVDAELSQINSGAKLACYHGIGHGWTNVHDEKLYGNERGMVTPAIVLCEEVTQDPEELKICATGVFDSISIGYYNQKYGLKIKKDDPYWLCREQKDKYKTACYMDLTPAILWLGGQRLTEAMKYISKVEPPYRDTFVLTVSEDSVRFIIKDNLKIEDQVAVCRSLGHTQHLICIQGLVAGYMQFGTPGSEESNGLNFCERSFLTSDEKDSCFQKLSINVRISYSADRNHSFCAKVPEVYKKYCLE